jgi:hypothetical protein
MQVKALGQGNAIEQRKLRLRFPADENSLQRREQISCQVKLTAKSFEAKDLRDIAAALAAQAGPLFTLGL